jgi:hypothetical protein
MKPQRIALLVFLALIGLGAVTKINQAPKQHTNAPGEPSCGGCHSGAVNTGPGLVNLNLPATGYVPGQTYTLNHAISDSTFANGTFGFSATALNSSNEPAGTFAVVNATNTSLQTANVLGNVRQYIGHVNANGTNSWTFQWTAPATDVGSITFYTSNIAANGNSSSSGDNAYDETFILSAVQPPTADFAVSGTFCEGSQLVFADSSSGVIDTYAWDFGPNASIPSASTAGPHTVSFDTLGPQTVRLITTGPGGVDTLEVVYQVNPLPVIFAGNDETFCEGTSISLSVSIFAGSAPFVYNWTCGPGLSDPNDPTPMVTPSDTSLYCVTLTDANGCTSQPDSIRLNVKPSPKALAGPDLFICEGETVFLQGGLALTNKAPGPFGFSWTPAADLSSPFVPNPAASPDSTTTYELLISSSNGCTSLPGDSSAMMTVFTIDTIRVDLGPDLTICEGDTLQLNPLLSGAPTASYRWIEQGNGYFSDSNAVNPFISPQSNTFYQLVVSSPGACSNDTATIAVAVSPFPVLPTIDFADDTLFATGAGGYQWYYYHEPTGDTIEVFGATDAFFPYDPYYYLATATGVIILASTNDAGCTTYTEPFNMPFPTDIQVIADPWFGQSIYPNPARDRLGVEFSYRVEDATVLWITDLKGRRLKTIAYAPSAYERDEIDIADLSPGIYFIHFYHGPEREIRQFVKQ